MTIRVTIAKALVGLSEAATDAADTMLRTAAGRAYDHLDDKLAHAQAQATQARQRIAAAERAAALTFQDKLAALNSKLEDRSYAIPAGKSPDAR